MAGLAPTHLQPVGHEGVRPQRLDHWVPPAHDLQHVLPSPFPILTVALCARDELGAAIPFLRGDLREAEEAVGDGELVDGVAEERVVLLDDGGEEGEVRLVRLEVERLPELRALLQLRAHAWGVVPPEVLGAREERPRRGDVAPLVFADLHDVLRRRGLIENEIAAGSEWT